MEIQTTAFRCSNYCLNMELATVSDAEWESSLFRAIAVGTNQEIEELMKPNVDVNISWKGSTPLHQALSKKRDVDIIKTLLRHRANVNLVDNHGDSPLHLAIFYCATAKIVKELLEYGADINAVDCFDATPLQLALSKGTAVEIVDELLEHGASVNVTDLDGSTPLHQCLSDEGDIEIIKGLLKWGAKVDVPDGNGNTPLHLAARCCGFVGYIKELLKHKGDINITNHSGRTPLHEATSRRVDLKIVKELLVYGADIYVVDNKGDTPLDFVLRTFNVEAVNKIFKYGLNAKLDSRICNQLLNKVINYIYIGIDMDMDINKTCVKPLVKYALVHTIEFNSNPFNFDRYLGLDTDNTLMPYLDDCVTELVKMRSVEVKAGLSLYNFITTKNINAVLDCSGEYAKAIDEENLIANYPIYKDLILPKIIYALDRKELLSELKQVFVYTRKCCSLDKGFREKVVLGDYAIANIAKYLCNDDLLNFGLAFYVQLK